MHSHHSHSGDYVEHAKDGLDDVVQEAIKKKFEVFCLTEHMPRLDYDHLYPEEIALEETVQSLEKLFDNYYHHAKRLQFDLKDRIHLLVGMEAERIDDRYYQYVSDLREKYDLDMIVGSIHHTNTIPIDYSQGRWYEARNMISDSGDEVKDTIALFERYFDDQYAMLQKLKPDVVGHFDLILLFCPNNLKKLVTTTNTVWEKVIRNISYIIEIGAIFEINSAAVRKGWESPYPSEEILKEIKSRDGEICLSDDSHGISQVGLNYHVAATYLRKLEMTTISYLYKTNGTVEKRTTSLDNLDTWISAL